MTAPPSQRSKAKPRWVPSRPAVPKTGPLAGRIVRPARLRSGQTGGEEQLVVVVPPEPSPKWDQRTRTSARRARFLLILAVALLGQWLRWLWFSVDWSFGGTGLLPKLQSLGRLRAIRLPRPRFARLPSRGAIAALVIWTVAGAALFSLYLHMSRTVPVDSDGASNALQAWSMLHGNLLLRGWQLSDVSFYTTELPEYMLIEAVRGLSADVVHLAAALTYTLLTLAAAMVAKGKATGGTGALRACLAAGIMLAPQQESLQVLLLSPDHVGSAVPVLLVWLLLDRAPRRWYVPCIGCLLLADALLADNIVLLTGIGPLAAVGIIRGYRVAADGGGRRAAAYEFSLAAAAGAAVGLARLAAAVITAHGGYTVWPVGHSLASTGRLSLNLSLAARGLLLLFGANFFGQNLGVAAALAILHLIGIGLVCWALCAALRRLASLDIAVQLLAVGILVSLAGYAFGRVAVNLDSTREFAAVLPLGAALAGRMLAGRLARARLVPAVALLLGCYLYAAGLVLAQPPAAPQNQQLTQWLAGHGLRYGLAGYWQANSVTVDSSHGAAGPQVQLRSLLRADGRLRPDTWETRPSWYNPRQHQANFVVLAPSSFGRWRAPSMNSALDTFGQPARIYDLGSYIVLVWDKNLLASLP